MVATVQIIEKTGAGGTGTQKDGGTVRFKNADNATVDSANPMVVPTSGFDFSYEKWLRLNVTVAPDNNLSNLAVYSDGAVWSANTGIAAYAKAVTAYSTPAEATTTTGYALLSSYTASGTLSLGATTVTGTGEKGDHCVLMLRVADTANPGTLSTETLTFQYDEL